MHQRLPPYWYSLAGEGMESLACFFGTNEANIMCSLLLKAKIFFPTIGINSVSTKLHVDSTISLAPTFRGLPIHHRSQPCLNSTFSMSLLPPVSLPLPWSFLHHRSQSRFNSTFNIAAIIRLPAPPGAALSQLHFQCRFGHQFRSNFLNLHIHHRSQFRFN